MDVLLAGGVFIVAYALIASERFDRTLVAMLGGLLVVPLGIIDQEEAFAGIDFNVIFLLAGMMILAGGLSRTGFFEYVAGLAIHARRRRTDQPRPGRPTCRRCPGTPRHAIRGWASSRAWFSSAYSRSCSSS